MRPTKLTIQGLTAYKQQVEVDFTGLDLFAITGPTGAGKSSLVDAITFALFGQAPRVGRDVKELISQGENQLKVELEFSSNGDRYRIHRSTARKGLAKIQFEQFDKAENEWKSAEDTARVKETNAAVGAVLNMDYEAFIRSVILPQGEFAEFLAGQPEQRRKVLDDLLQLDVYKRMHQRANALATEKKSATEALQHRLETELADATPEALEAAKSQLKQLRARANDLAKLRVATENAVRIAEAITAARGRERDARERHAVAAKALAEATKLVTESKLLIAGLDARVAAVADEITAAKYDADLHLRLTKCLPLLKQIDDSSRREAKLVADVTAKTADVEKLRAGAEAARKQHDAAQLASKTRHDEFEAARQANATEVLLSGLAKGDQCPVCGQKVATVPKANKGAGERLAKAKTVLEKAQADEKVANARVTAAQTKVAVEERELKSLDKQIAELKEVRTQIAAEVAITLGEPDATMAGVEKRVQTLESAKKQRESLEGKRDALIAERARDIAKIEDARTAVIKLDTEVKSHDADAIGAAGDARKATQLLAEAAKEMSRDDVTNILGANGDVARLLADRAHDIQSEERDVNQEIGGCSKQIEQISKEIDLAARLREEEKSHREDAAIARDLASLLRVDSFPAFLRERAMKVLATAGSEKLREVSSGRYDLIADGQDFAVEDLWNASEPRPVRTLSGGETFLASLALALALVEHLSALAGNGHRNTLESLFIDEGFSHLDAETLDVVASALEVLGQDRRRLIGVVTHVPALAERMPARITVHKSQGGSTVTVE